MSDASIVEYFAEHEHYKCGYCGSPDTNSSHGMWAHTLTTEDYQDLIDRGWRRSGKYVYKPTMSQTCCPQYAIRCQVADFKLTRSQKKVIKRVNKYLNTGERTAGGETDDRGAGGVETSPSSTATVGVGVGVGGSTEGNLAGKEKGSLAAGGEAKLAETVRQKKVTTSQSEGNVPRKEPRKTPRPGRGADPDKPHQKKAKELRLERWRQKQADKKGDGGDKKGFQKKPLINESKTLEDYLSDISHTPAHKLEIRLIRSSPPSTDFNDSFPESFAVYQKYQMSVHKDPLEECDEKSFRGFLVDSPLEPMYREGGSESGFGSFHQHYILDGQIIGVGVLDILPYCISSVYFYYDPAFSFLSLGTYSALREVAFTKHLQTLEPSIEQYYMGFYIHSCPKMRYKGQFSASYLLCPESYTWHPYQKCVPKLDASKYTRFAAPDVEDDDSKIDIKSVLVLTMRQRMPYFIYKSLRPDTNDEAEVKEYAGFVGRTCAERMMLYRA
ncbi:hypothetical protein NP493_71g00004 [Ridgeia piscesae]|uniref:Arginyl-tRNA--protein transferase 1 n=1 Tax=Ridgeia piscesae TaxID=27915 RepID=A0AAD9P9Q6_RIDPI|nr:hypothetical protein NP493_71g00004 [Ridgeia piscesae]